MARWLRAIGLVTVAAMIAAACGSSKSSESSDEATPAERWSVSLTTASGQPLPETTLKSGRVAPALVIGGRYVVSATVPASLRSKVAGKTMVLQHRARSDDAWTTLKQLKMDGEGRIRDEFTAGTDLIHLRDYRVAVVEPSAPEASPETNDAAGKSPFRLIAATQPAQTAATTAVTSDTTSVAGVVQFVVQIVNSTGNNLNIYVPTAQSNGTYNEGKVAIANGTTQSLLYTQPPPGAAVHFRVNKQKCFGGCTNYVVNWNYQPYDPRTGQKVPGYTPCSASMPQFTSNQVYKVELKQGIPGAGFAAGFLSGQIGGAGTGYKTCTFDLESKLVNWLQSNPVKGFLAVAAATALVVAAVAVVVATAGAAAPVEAAMGELIADAVVEEVAVDAATDAAGDVVEAEIDAVEGAVPEAAGPDYFEFQEADGYINPTSNDPGPTGRVANWFDDGTIISNYIFKD